MKQSVKRSLRLVVLVAAMVATSQAIAEPPDDGFAVTTEQVSLRDGATVKADVYLPPHSGTLPAVLIMTPYGRDRHGPGLLATRAEDPSAGFFGGLEYAVVVADWRSTLTANAAPEGGGDSNLGEDGFDVVEWVARQSWCDGNVGMYGPSALGNIQYATAEHQPPHLRAIMPVVSDFANSYLKYYHGGVLRKAWMDQYEAIGWGGVLARPIMAHPLDDGFYEGRVYGHPAKIRAPALLVGGWFDLHDMPRVFNEYVAGSPPEVASRDRLIVGPWTHGGTTREVPQGELEFTGSTVRARTAQKHFFDHWLRGLDNGEESSPRVLYYVLGLNEWRTADAWPPPGVGDAALHLEAGGLLSVERPHASAPEAFTFDPDDPVPTVGGGNLNRSLIRGPADQREKVESRPDVLVYSTAPLHREVTIAGNVKAVLFVSADADDTDVAIRLTDVYPDGRSMLLTDGILRLSLRESFRQPGFLEPGRVYEVKVTTPSLAASFLPGHRIRLVIAASNYPRFDVNSRARDDQGQPRKVTDTLYHDPEHPSALILPVAEGGARSVGRVLMNMCGDVSVAPTPSH